MGHIRLGRLPGYPNWQRVVETVADPATSLETVAAETADAAKAELRRSAGRPYIWYPYWLLIQLADEARHSERFAELLREHGIELAQDDSALAFVSAITRAVENKREEFGSPSAIDELALNAFHRAVSDIVLSDADSLFETVVEDVRRAFGRFAPRRAFGRLSRVFLGAFYAEVLRYFLSFELGNHVGAAGRFDSLESAERFNRDLARYTHRVSELVERFAEGWYSKQLWEEEAISQEAVRRFLHVAFRKFQQQLEIEAA